jgi:cold shock CspA family protein
MVIENKDEEHTGIVKWYNNQKGFGIIIEDNSKEEVFTHYSEIYENNKGKHIVLEENERVRFNLETKNAKICARCIKPYDNEFKNVKLHDETNNKRNNNHTNNHKANNKNENRKKNIKKRNTTEFSPSHEAVDLRLMVHEPLEKYTKDISVRDVILVKNMFKTDENIYGKLKYEIDNSGVKMDELWKSWHGDTHYIADDSLDWKDKCPTFKYVLDKIATFFNMQIKATRLNFYSDSKEWKPFHHDAAAVKKDKAKTQNITITVSFGLEREVAFQHANHGTVISMPAEDGSAYAFCRDVNVMWKHGVRQMKDEDYKAEGRFSVIAWGWRDMTEV